jgi:hypothetical protein
MDDLEKVLAKLFHGERALERAIGFTSSFVTLGAVLGHGPKTTIDQWIDPKSNDYRLRRSEEWDAPDRNANIIQGDGENIRKMGTGTPPAELGQGKHSEIEVLSLIREALWDRAEWSGTAFFFNATGSEPPIFAPFFKDADAAGDIFLHWRNDLGVEDEKDRLRLTVIRGVNRAKPFAYRVVVGVNPLTMRSRPSVNQFAMIIRWNMMEPPNGINLCHFLEAYKKAGCYLLAHAIPLEGRPEPELVLKNSILKRHLYVREAWEIGLNDLDIVGIVDGDEPIIPPEIEKAPVIEALDFVKRIRANVSPE